MSNSLNIFQRFTSTKTFNQAVLEFRNEILFLGLTRRCLKVFLDTEGYIGGVWTISGSKAKFLDKASDHLK